MGFRDKNRDPQDGRINNEPVQPGASVGDEAPATATPPGETTMDVYQRQVQEGNAPEGIEMAVSHQDNVGQPQEVQARNEEQREMVEDNTPRASREDFDLEDPQEVDREPKQVEPEKVTFMPRKSFEARVNTTQYHFSKGVEARVTRDVANMLLEDEERGYVKE
jgi:hypothetical protein